MTVGHAFLAAFLVVMSIGLVSMIVSGAISAAVFSVIGAGGDRNSPLAAIPVLFSFVGFALQYAAATCVTARMADGRAAGVRPTIGELFAWTFPRLLPVALTGFFYLVAYVIGLFLFFIPSIFVRLFFIVAGPARAVENISWAGAFGRSAKLTENNRLAIFAAQFVYGIIMTVAFYAAIFAIALAFAALGLAAPGVGGDLPEVGSLLAIVIVVVLLVLFLAAFVVLMLLNAALPASVYVELKDVKEGGARIDQVFA